MRAQASIASRPSRGPCPCRSRPGRPSATPNERSSVRDAARLVEQVAVGDRTRVAGLALPVERDLVAVARLHVAVEAVVRDVELAADEPLGEREIPLEDRVPLAATSRARAPGWPRSPASRARRRRRPWRRCRARSCGTLRAAGRFAPPASSASSASVMLGSPLLRVRRRLAEPASRPGSARASVTTRWRAEAGGVDERGGLRRRGCGRPAPRGRRCARAPPTRGGPRRRGSSMPRPRSHSACDSSRHEREPRRACAARPSCSRTTSAVMSCVAGCVERVQFPARAPGRCAAIPARPARPGPPRRRRSRRPRPRRGAAARPHAANHASMPRGIGRRAPGTTGEVARDLARARPRRWPARAPAPRTNSPPPRARPAPPASVVPSHSATPNGRLSSSSLAITTPSSSSAGSSSSDTNTGPDPATGDRRVVGRLAARTARAPRRPVRDRSSSRCAARSAAERSTST